MYGSSSSSSSCSRSSTGTRLVPCMYCATHILHLTYLSVSRKGIGERVSCFYCRSRCLGPELTRNLPNRISFFLVSGILLSAPCAGVNARLAAPPIVCATPLFAAGEKKCARPPSRREMNWVRLRRTYPSFFALGHFAVQLVVEIFWGVRFAVWYIYDKLMHSFHNRQICPLEGLFYLQGCPDVGGLSAPPSSGLPFTVKDVR